MKLNDFIDEIHANAVDMDGGKKNAHTARCLPLSIPNGRRLSKNTALADRSCGMCAQWQIVRCATGQIRTAITRDMNAA